MRRYHSRHNLIEDIEMGMIRSLEKVITDRDIEMFAEVSTDHNPVHIDDEYAQNTMYEGRIAYGMLSARLISAVICEQLPGMVRFTWHRTLNFWLRCAPETLFIHK